MRKSDKKKPRRLGAMARKELLERFGKMAGGAASSTTSQNQNEPPKDAPKDNLPIPYVAPEKFSVQEQYKAGTRNQSHVHIYLLNNEKDTTHFYQGFLCWAASRDEVDLLKEMIINRDGKFPDLSMSYDDNAVLFNAVIGNANGAIEFLLEAGADPQQMIEARKGEKFHTLFQKRLDAFQERLDRATFETLSPHLATWVPPSRSLK